MKQLRNLKRGDQISVNGVVVSVGAIWPGEDKDGRHCEDTVNLMVEDGVEAFKVRGKFVSDKQVMGAPQGLRLVS